jgi:hypothetical protein
VVSVVSVDIRFCSRKQKSAPLKIPKDLSEAHHFSRCPAAMPDLHMLYRLKSVPHYLAIVNRGPFAVAISGPRPHRAQWIVTGIEKMAAPTVSAAPLDTPSTAWHARQCHTSSAGGGCCGLTNSGMALT